MMSVHPDLRRGLGMVDGYAILTAAQWRLQGLRDHQFVVVGEDTLNDSGQVEWLHNFSDLTVLRSFNFAVDAGHIIVGQRRVSFDRYPHFHRLARLIPERCPL